MSLNLVPLRIRTGWKVNLNDFTESFPDKFTDDNYEHRWEFKEDILQLESEHKKRVMISAGILNLMQTVNIR